MEIKAGQELDVAVAEAIGMQYAGYYRRGPAYCLRGEQTNLKSHVEVGVNWNPSTDLNAAFAAAEKVDLFGGCSLGLGHPDGRRVWIASSFDGIVSEGTTPALAICAAILKLKGTLS